MACTGELGGKVQRVAPGLDSGTSYHIIDTPNRGLRDSFKNIEGKRTLIWYHDSGMHQIFQITVEDVWTNEKIDYDYLTWLCSVLALAVFLPVTDMESALVFEHLNEVKHKRSWSAVLESTQRAAVQGCKTTTFASLWYSGSPWRWFLKMWRSKSDRGVI